MEQAPQAVAEVLDALAERFGETGAHLWEVMVWQQILEGWFFGVLLMPVWAAVFYGGFRLTGKRVRAKSQADEDIIKVGVVACGAVLMFISGLVIAVNTEKILAIFNPEYYALRDILRLISM